MCLWCLIFMVLHFSPLQGFQFRVLEMWLIESPLPSPAQLHCSGMCSPARSDTGHTAGRQERRALPRDILLQDSATRRHAPFYTCAGSLSFSWPTCSGLVGSIFCAVVVESLKRPALSKYAGCVIHWAAACIALVTQLCPHKAAGSTLVIL